MKLVLCENGVKSVINLPRMQSEIAIVIEWEREREGHNKLAKQRQWKSTNVVSLSLWQLIPFQLVFAARNCFPSEQADREADRERKRDRERHSETASSAALQQLCSLYPAQKCTRLVILIHNKHNKLKKNWISALKKPSDLELYVSCASEISHKRVIWVDATSVYLKTSFWLL